MVDVKWMGQACGTGCGHVTGVADIASDVRLAVPECRRTGALLLSVLVNVKD
ncbi:MAG: hypothetical protein KME26_21880 [Oscillatoria princeps RMCB-10]|nr:hypothetical protein [Oscillatoria princeps RMCB-10]